MTEPTLEPLPVAEPHPESPLEERLRDTFIEISRRLCTDRPSVDIFAGELVSRLANAAELSEVGIWLLDRDGERAHRELRFSNSKIGTANKSARHESPLTLGPNAVSLATPTLFAWAEGAAQSDDEGATSTFAVPIHSGQTPIGFLMLEQARPTPWSALASRWIYEIAGLVGACQHGEALARPNREARQARRRARLGLMAGGIAHDLNNLLVGINGGLELAFQVVSADSALHGDLELIERSAKRALGLSDSLVAFAGGRQTPLEEVVLNDLVLEAARDTAAGAPSCELRFELHQALPDLQSDPLQLRQIVASLVSNAANALGESSEAVIVRTGIVDATAIEGGDDWVLRPTGSAASYQFVEVQDQGHGIPRRLRERVFEPFFSTRNGARGVGLAVALGLVEGRKGAIHLRSNPEDGTTVRVLLPVSTPGVQSPEDPASNATSGAVVLVVDDDLSVLATVTRMLRANGHHVLTASSGIEALELFERREFSVDAVLIDVEMPGIDGIETLTRIRRIDPDVRAVLISGYSPRIDMGSEASAPFLRKPFTGTQLLALIPVQRSENALQGGS
ncbi:MAG: signal transduction histidine kinase [Chlamydiales bacterium]|jgi:signal transduction histidine kinase